MRYGHDSAGQPLLQTMTNLGFMFLVFLDVEEIAVALWWMRTRALYMEPSRQVLCIVTTVSVFLYIAAS